MQVEPIKRQPDQPTPDDVPDQGAEDVFPDVYGDRGVLSEHHPAESRPCFDQLLTSRKSMKFWRRGLQRDDEHVGDDVLELRDD